MQMQDFVTRDSNLGVPKGQESRGVWGRASLEKGFEIWDVGDSLFWVPLHYPSMN